MKDYYLINLVAKLENVCISKFLNSEVFWIREIQKYLGFQIYKVESMQVLKYVKCGKQFKTVGSEHTEFLN